MRRSVLVRVLGAVCLLAAGLYASGVAVSGRLALLPGFVTKSHAPSTGTPAADLTYSLAASNTDVTTTVVSVTIFDNLPPGLTAQSASAGCTGSATVACSVGTLAPGSASKTFAVVVRPPSAGTYANSAYAVGDSCFGDGCPVTTPTTTDVATVTVPAIAIADAAVDEGNASRTNASFDVTLSKPSGQTITVAYATADGTATAGTDYDATSGQLTFAPGVTSQTISVPVAGDTLVEPDETFTVTLSSPVNATLAAAQATGTIRNDDRPSDLALTGSAPDGVVGTPFAYTLTATNPGPSSATGVHVKDTLPTNVVFVSATASQGTCSGTGPVDCDLGTLAPASSATVTITVRPTDVGPLSDDAQLSSAEPDPNAANNAVTIRSAVALPPPVPGVAANVAPTKGKVTIKLRGSSSFVPLTGPEQIPVGSTIDTRNGSLRLTTAEGTTLVYAGQFVLSEVRVAPGSGARVPVAVLTGGDFASCPKRAKGRRTSARDPLRRVVRRLWSNGKGRFRTRGRYATATIRGTLFLVEDRCDGTRTVVRSGAVLVNDLRRHKTVVVRAGRSYLVPRP